MFCKKIKYIMLFVSNILNNLLELIPKNLLLLSIICIIFFRSALTSLLIFLVFTIVITFGILLYLKNEFFSFLILFIYSGAIVILFIFLLQLYDITIFRKKKSFKKNTNLWFLSGLFKFFIFFFIFYLCSEIILCFSYFYQLNIAYVNTFQELFHFENNTLITLSITISQYKDKLVILIGLILLISLQTILLIIISKKD